ncbi:hypothetical protein ES703_114605 [subsurface metagenome]
MTFPEFHISPILALRFVVLVDTRSLYAPWVSPSLSENVQENSGVKSITLAGLVWSSHFGLNGAFGGVFNDGSG